MGEYIIIDSISSLLLMLLIIIILSYATESLFLMCLLLCLFSLLTFKNIFGLDSENCKCPLNSSEVFSSVLVQMMEMFCKSITQIHAVGKCDNFFVLLPILNILILKYVLYFKIYHSLNSSEVIFFPTFVYQIYFPHM